MDKNRLRYSLSSNGTDLAQGVHAQIPGLNAKEQNLLLMSPRSLSVDLNPGPEISLLLLCLSGSITENLTIYAQCFGPNRRLKRCLQNQTPQRCANTLPDAGKSLIFPGSSKYLHGAYLSLEEKVILFTITELLNPHVLQGLERGCEHYPQKE